MLISNPLIKLTRCGQSIWLDYIERRILLDGTLARLIEEDGVSGVTSNPTIFEKAISGDGDYTAQLSVLTQRGAGAIEIYEALTFEDIKKAADLLRPVYERTNGGDGFVSLEVSPHLAYGTKGTIAEARRFWAQLDRPNVLIKVPATREGLPAIQKLIAEGINVNVTLLFGLQRYQDVAEAYMAGLEQRVAAKLPLERVASVASFFLSRIDVLVDQKLDTIDPHRTNESITVLRGQAAIASARLAYQAYKTLIAGRRWRGLADRGARSQRLLWASTGTKNPLYSEVKYVEALIGPDTINTLPPDTLEAYRKLGQPAVRLEEGLDSAREVSEKLMALGIDLELIGQQQLESEGVQKFIVPFDKVLARFGKAARQPLRQ